MFARDTARCRVVHVDLKRNWMTIFYHEEYVVLNLNLNQVTSTGFIRLNALPGIKSRVDCQRLA